jgi:hypothetical protein
MAEAVVAEEDARGAPDQRIREKTTKKTTLS